MTKILPSLAFGAAAVLCGPAAAAVETPDPALTAQAKVSEAEARNTALSRVPGGTIKDGELEKEHGKLIWSFDIAIPKTKSITEVQVDAVTGTVVSTQVESVKDQNREAQADRREAARKASGKVKHRT